MAYWCQPLLSITYHLKKYTQRRFHEQCFHYFTKTMGGKLCICSLNGQIKSMSIFTDHYFLITSTNKPPKYLYCLLGDSDTFAALKQKPINKRYALKSQHIPRKGGSKMENESGKFVNVWPQYHPHQNLQGCLFICSSVLNLSRIDTQCCINLKTWVELTHNVALTSGVRPSDYTSLYTGGSSKTLFLGSPTTPLGIYIPDRHSEVIWIYPKLWGQSVVFGVPIYRFSSSREKEPLLSIFLSSVFLETFWSPFALTRIPISSEEKKENWF